MWGLTAEVWIYEHKYPFEKLTEAVYQFQNNEMKKYFKYSSADDVLAFQTTITITNSNERVLISHQFALFLSDGGCLI